MRLPSKDSIPLVLLTLGILAIIPWVTAKAKESAPEGLERWKDRAMEIDTDHVEPDLNVKLRIESFSSTYFPTSATASYWIISASEASLEQADRIELDRPMVRIVDPTKDDRITVIRGTSGYCKTDGHYVELSGNVRSRSYKGDYLETKDLCYDAEKGLIYSEGDFVYTWTKDADPVRGTGISCTPKMTHLKFGKLRGKIPASFRFMN